jgi:hypothetical protein
MVDQVERVTTVQEPTETTTRTVRDEPVATRTEPTSNFAVRIIWYIAGVLLVLLAFRFVLALLGANPNNGFANFIYTASHPFVAPFFSLFGYSLRYGVTRFETFTLVAMAVYAIVAWGLARLVTLNRPRV